MARHGQEQRFDANGTAQRGGAAFISIASNCELKGGGKGTEQEHTAAELANQRQRGCMPRRTAARREQGMLSGPHSNDILTR